MTFFYDVAGGGRKVGKDFVMQIVSFFYGNGEEHLSESLVLTRSPEQLIKITFPEVIKTAIRLGIKPRFGYIWALAQVTAFGACGFLFKNSPLLITFVILKN